MFARMDFDKTLDIDITERSSSEVFLAVAKDGHRPSSDGKDTDQGNHQQDENMEQEENDPEGTSYSNKQQEVEVKCKEDENSSERNVKSGVRSRMMQNMLRGEASAIHECIFVVIAGQLLAFNSGYINGACLSGWLVKTGKRQAVAAFTGAYTGSALTLADGHVDEFWFQICMIFSFILGALISGLMTPNPTPYRIEPTYGPTFCIGGLFLIASSILAAVSQQNEDDNDSNNTAQDYVFYLAAVANGIQNGMSSIYSGNLIRSTHLTGTSTDIGLFTGQLLRGNSSNNWKLLVLIALAVSFWTGGFVSFFATEHFTSLSLLFNAGLFLFVGFLLVVFLMHEYSITMMQALLGTWRWKKVINRLSTHFNMDERMSTRHLNPKEKLIALFPKLDADGSGTINPDELLEALIASGYKMRMKHVKSMINFADKNGDGAISFEEWQLIVDELFQA